MSGVYTTDQSKTLSSLADVNTNNLQNDQPLVYQDGLWINKTPVYFHGAYTSIQSEPSSGGSTSYSYDLTNWTEIHSNPSGQLGVDKKTWTAPEDGIYQIAVSAQYNNNLGDVMNQAELSLYLNGSTLQEKSIFWAGGTDDDFQYIECNIHTTKPLSAGDTLHLYAFAKMNTASAYFRTSSDNTRWNIFKIA